MLRRLETEQGLIIASMVTYKRLLNNEPQPEAACHIGISPSSYHQLENCGPGIRVDLLPQIGDYLGFDIKTLMDYVAEMEKGKDQLAQELGGQLNLVPVRNITNGRYPRLRRTYDLSQTSYKNPEGVKTANILAVNSSPLPHLDLSLVYADCARLLADGKVPFIESVLTRPFTLVLERHRQVS